MALNGDKDFFDLWALDRSGGALKMNISPQNTCGREYDNFVFKHRET